MKLSKLLLPLILACSITSPALSQSNPAFDPVEIQRHEVDQFDKVNEMNRQAGSNGQSNGEGFDFYKWWKEGGKDWTKIGLIGLFYLSVMVSNAYKE
ncbi:hypothetical protein NIES22_50780 [Calothrix brevissima NIES-22]|nr:hypothetical protein NIES22_50780 [Calothrix brevissima NIES-22]